MKLVIQRVKKAAVSVDGEVVGSCEKGLMMLLGVAEGDSENDAHILARKVLGLRIFSDENDKMNLSLKDIDGEALVVSNFTLGANYAHGNRPDFLGAEAPERANELYEYFVSLLRKEIGTVETGVFGAHMDLSIEANGPVTIIMESDVLKRKGK